jgi:hypothetical protein
MDGAADPVFRASRNVERARRRIGENGDEVKNRDAEYRDDHARAPNYGHAP